MVGFRRQKRCYKMCQMGHKFTSPPIVNEVIEAPILFQLIKNSKVICQFTSASPSFSSPSSEKKMLRIQNKISRCQACCLTNGTQILLHQPLFDAVSMVIMATIKLSNVLTIDKHFLHRSFRNHMLQHIIQAYRRQSTSQSFRFT